MDPDRTMIADVVKLPASMFRTFEPVYYDPDHQIACEGGSICKCFLIGHATEPAGAGTGLVRVRFVSPFRQVKPDAPSFKPIPSSTITFTVPPGGTVLPPGWSATPIAPPSVRLLELKEFCYASSLPLPSENKRVLVNHVRDVLRCHRFDVLAWLMQNGVQIPADLLSDNTHPQVGNQSPDRPTTVAPPAS